MSYDVIQSIKNNLASIKGGLDEDTKAVAGGGAAANNRISIKGGVFRKFTNGKEIAAIEDRFMNVIFVRMAHTPARTYYNAGYQEGVKAGPTCWSSDSKVPDADVKNPPSSTCAACMHSAKNSNVSGSGTACRLQWRTAVVLPNHPDGDVMQLVLPATSVFGKEEGGKYPFRAYIQMLAANNISAGRVVTKMQFDTKSPVPKLLFSPVDVVREQDMDTIIEQSKSSAAENAIKLNVYQTDEGMVAVEPAKLFAPVVNEETVEPVLRQTAKSEEMIEGNDLSDVVKKWGKKK